LRGLHRIFQINLLFVGLLLACLSISVQYLPASVASDEKFVKLPVEVVGADGKTEWAMVRVSDQMIPEPRAAALLALSSLLLLRRRRGQ
jgi:hypothetical protein